MTATSRIPKIASKTMCRRVAPVPSAPARAARPRRRAVAPSLSAEPAGLTAPVASHDSRAYVSSDAPRRRCAPTASAASSPLRMAGPMPSPLRSRARPAASPTRQKPRPGQAPRRLPAHDVGVAAERLDRQAAREMP